MSPRGFDALLSVFGGDRVQHQTTTSLFALALRRTRESAGASLSALARKAGYHPSTLSKIENGQRDASRDLAEDLDTALKAQGALLKVWHAARSTTDTDVSLIWVLIPTSEGVSPMALSRRDLVAAILAAAGGAAMAAPPSALATTTNPSPETILGMRRLLEEFWRLGRITDPATLIPSLTGQISTIGTFAPNATGSVRTDLFGLGARFAEYLAYMFEEIDDRSAARYWIDRGEQMARAAADVEMAAYMWVRRSRVLASDRSTAEAIAAAQRARSASVGPSLRTVSLLREAEGLAQRGEDTRAHRALDAAAEFHIVADPAEGTWCSRTVPGVVEVVRARVLVDLGRPGDAAEVLDGQLPMIPATSRRQRMRYGLLLALARSREGEHEEAIRLTRVALDEGMGVRSAEARALAVELRESLAWSDASGARALRRDLAALPG
ncbi:helix-turn-helix domain-containing protein [Actinoalloteichus hymeniacidonis]|uniref:helix-turn-helix domain-containing protein n=1 Tax=Actinoalloteichus hymeniacidonis TaxID=340345 RepID=UPI002989B436|nr:helix-turn-helix transcriptional regulator [Actinoalloteichus hymeniacidonis]